LRILHLCWGLEPTNGAANIARLVIDEQRKLGHEVELRSSYSREEIAACDELWCHCGWYWRIWLAVALARKLEKRICWMPECCYDPIRLRYHGWKKRLAGVFERRALRMSSVLIATCSAEAGWIRDYVGASCPKIEASDIWRFFKPNDAPVGKGGTHVLYLGRRHPLKGVEYLERAVGELNAEGPQVELRIVSDHHGEELEADWRWCDVLCLPTLSDNFGIVIAEALERGKRVITTDGAPAWEKFDGRIAYLKGFRNGSDRERVKMLKEAMSRQIFGSSRSADRIASEVI